MNKQNKIIGFIILGIMLFGFTCLACGVSIFGLSRWVRNNDLTADEPVKVEVISPSTPSTAENSQDPEQSAGVYSSTLETLKDVEIPINDPIDIAQRLEGKENIPLTLPVTDLDRQVGEKESFWVTNIDNAENFQVQTTLAAVTDHLYFWIEDGVDYSQIALNKLVREFEDVIYPINQEFFGSEWFPGIDEDPHLYVIYASALGNSVAGYYNSTDEYHPIVNEFSNAHETFMVNADNQTLSANFTYGVLAHEFQHMIHWYRDRNETSWLNEGFSELSTLLTGQRDGPSHDYYFADNPDTQLNDWPNDPNETTPHYGNAFLFVTYFMDRFGSDATKALVADELNGLESIDNVLDSLGIVDPDSGIPLTADDVVLDWVVTNYLKDQYNVSDRFSYLSYPYAPNFYPTETIDSCSTDQIQRDVHQYAADYIEISCLEDFSLHFTGQQSVQVIPENPYSGSFAYWSNKGDHSDMRLTREFDFSNVSGPITLSYWTWYDLEEDYDYVFLEVSSNGGEWRIIRTPSSTSENPSGNSYGWGYNGLSGGDGTWIQEQVDLSRYAGEIIKLRFEYITDAAVHGEGLLLDSISIPEISYFTDFETDSGGWIPEGFVRIENNLPQTYRLALLHLGAVPRVEYLTLSDGNQVDIPVSPGETGSSSTILVVTGTTRFTRQKANYWLEFTEN